MWELQDRRKEVDSSSAVAIAQLGGSSTLGSIRTAGWHGDTAAPIKLIFWARLGGAGAGTGGIERLVGMAHVWRAPCWGGPRREASGVLV